MNRKSLTTILSLLLGLAAVVAVMAGMSNSHPALAHPVTVDGALTEWMTDVPLPPANNGHVMRNVAYEGEFIWNDAQGDERTDFANPDTRVDIVEMRVTGDASNLYFLFRMRDIDQATGNGAPMVQIAVDTDRVPGSGEVWFGGFADTRVNSSAAWERLITTRFGSGNSDLRVWDTGWNASYVGTAVISDAAETIEGAIPWSALGFSAPPTLPLRFTVATFRANTSDNTWDIGGSGTSNALDAVTTQSGNTWGEVQDGVVDYYFDIYFERDGDPTSPLQVSEAYVNALGSTEDPNEYIELYNPAQYLAYLDGLILTDEGNQSTFNEAAYQFPGIPLTGTAYPVLPGEYIVIAVDAKDFDEDISFPDHHWADWEMYQGAGDYDNPAVPNLVRLSAFANSEIALANNGDQVILADGSLTSTPILSYTVIDGISWGSPGEPTWADTAITETLPKSGSIGDGQGVERLVPGADTNNSNSDLAIGPGTPGFARGLINHSLYQKGPAEVGLGSQFNYFLYWQVAGQNAPSAVITDILPNGVEFVTFTSSYAGVTLDASGAPTLVFSLGNVLSSTIGKITLTVQVATDLPLGTLLTNIATIDSASTVTEGIQTDDLSVLTTTVRGADLVVDKSGPLVAMPGERITYTIVVTNSGLADTADLVLTDTLPEYTTYVTDTTGVEPVNPGVGTYMWTLPGISGGGVYSFYLVCDVSNLAPYGALLTDTVSVATTTPEEDTANNQDRFLTTVGGPDLVVRKLAPETAKPGTLISFTLEAANSGPIPATNVWLTDTLPVQTEYYTDTVGGPDGQEGQEYGWYLGTLLPGDRVAFTVAVTVSSSAYAGDLLTNTVRVVADQGDQNPSDNMTQTVTLVSGANPYVQKSASADVLFGGETVVYTLTYGNRGTVSAENVILTDTLPVGFAYLEDDSGLPREEIGNIIRWTVGSLAGGAEVNFRITATVATNTPITKGTLVTNVVTIGAEGLGNNPADDMASVTGTVYQLVPIAIARAGATSETFAVEGTVIYTPGTYNTLEWGIQDDSGGIAVYYSPAPSVSYGDRVRVVATRGAYQNQEQLNAPVYFFANLGSGPEVPPRLYSTGAISTGVTEGWLVQVEGHVSGLGACTGNYSFLVNDGSGPAYIYVDQDTGVNVCTMGITNTDYVRVVGFSTQYQSLYEIKPRRPSDVKELYPTTFTYHDLEDVVRSGEAVYLAGSFNGWSTTATPMNPSADFSVFSVTVTLEQTGTYEYKYVVYTDTVSGPAQWDWLQRSGPESNRSINVTAPHQVVDDYRNVAVGWAKLQWPPAITITLGQSTGDIYGRVYIHNVTNLPGEGRGIRAQVGYGNSADPAGWTWFPMTFNVDVDDGANDEFEGAFIPAAAGVYSYAVRFDGNWGPGNPSAGWTYGDLDGVHPTEPFELDQCGVLTVLAPSLSVAKSVAPQADVPPGGVVTYTVVLSNSGAGNALGVVLTDALPVEVTFGGWVQQPTGAIYENGIITWTGEVAGGAEVRLVFTATLGTDSGLYNRTVVNTARFVSDTAGSGSAQATFTTARRYWVYLPLVMRNWKP